MALDVIVACHSRGRHEPGRAIGPMIASMSFANWYVYWIGPIIGAVIAALIYTYCIRQK